MIFNKDVTFPYPVLTSFNEDYPAAEFNLYLDFEIIDDYYQFKVNYALTSPFLMELIESNKAIFKCVIRSHDSRIFTYNPINPYIKIPRNRISLAKKVYVQLSIVTMQEISFSNNEDIDPYYKRVRDKILIPKNHILALSDISNFNGELKEPFKLFNYSIDKELKTDISFELSKEMIHIRLKDNNYLYQKGQRTNALNYHYVYMGLQKALAKFIFNNGDGSDSVILDEMEAGQTLLDDKLLIYMQNKGVSEISMDSIDNVIYQITDRVMQKHNNAILKGDY